MSDLIVAGNGALTMSSREIAGLTGKRHDHVMRDIILMLQVLHGEQGVPRFEDTYINDQNKQVYPCFNLPKRETLILVSGYSIDLRAKIIDRWQELESQNKPQIPQTYAAALLEAGRLALEVEKQAEQLRIAAPKVDFVDRFTGRDSLQNATQIGQTMKMSAVTMNRHLDAIGGVYNKSVKRGRAFCQSWVDGGFGKMVQNEIGYPQALFTTAGVARITEIFISEGVI